MVRITLVDEVEIDVDDSDEAIATFGEFKVGDKVRCNGCKYGPCSDIVIAGVTPMKDKKPAVLWVYMPDDEGMASYCNNGKYEK